MKLTIEVTPRQFADLMITFIESGDPVTNGWCQGVYVHAAGPNTHTLIESNKRHRPWYDMEEVFADPTLKLRVTEINDDGGEEGTADIDHFVSFSDIGSGLEKLARAKSYSHHLADLLADHGDAATADIVMQFIVFGEEKYA